MRIYIVVTIQEGDPDMFGDIVGVFKSEKDAEAMCERVKTASPEDLEELEVFTDFNTVMVIGRELQ